MIRFVLVAALAACSHGAVAPQLDGSPSDGHADDDAAAPDDAPVDVAAGAYRHTITIDGTDDFVVAEIFGTSSTDYAAKLSWDNENLYLGYSGADFDPAAPATATKWLFAYLDLDPGAVSGAATSQLYRTQQATLPAGFGAEFYVRLKCDATVVSLEQHQAGGTWVTAATPVSARAGTFVELAIPRSTFGGATTIGVVTWMINEQQGVEGTYAGLYAGTFTDGYNKSPTKYLRADFTSARVPNDPANQKP